MAWSVGDLTSITTLLTQNLTAAVKASPMYVAQAFPFEVSGLMPAASRHDGTNVMSLYLLHVSRDPAWRNTPVQASRAQWNQSQPLSLDLSYLLTTYAEKNWQMEQYLMSVALMYFHANPIYKSATAEFSITVEADSIDEMSRLWQAISVPIRLSAMFRVAVVFLAPQAPPVGDSRTPVEVNLSIGADLNAPAPKPHPEPRLFELALQVVYRVPPGASAASQASTVNGQAVVVGGQPVRVRGSGLDGADAGSVFLSLPGGGAEWPADSSWRVSGTSASGTAGNADELVLALPIAYASTPVPGTTLAATPPPGNYLLTVGNSGSSFRSNSLPLAIGPRIDGVPAGQPVLAPDLTGLYTMQAGGLVDAATAILLEDDPLTIAGAPAAGVAQVDAAAGTIGWMLPSPAGFPSGTYVRVRVQVNGIDAPPGWWVQIP